MSMNQEKILKTLKSERSGLGFFSFSDPSPAHFSPKTDDEFV